MKSRSAPRPARPSSSTLPPKASAPNSKADLTLLDAGGAALASQGEFDNGDPLLAWTFAADGTYKIRVADQTDNGSPDHFYSLTHGPIADRHGGFPAQRRHQRAGGRAIDRIQSGRNGQNPRATDQRRANWKFLLTPKNTARGGSSKSLVTDGPELVESGVEHLAGAGHADARPLRRSAAGSIRRDVRAEDADFFDSMPGPGRS